jgi:hypothetical protein
MSWVCPTCQHEWPAMPNGGSLPEVLESVNRARAERGEAPLVRGKGYRDNPFGCHDCGWAK